MALKPKVKQVGEKPLPYLEFVETPRNWYPRVVLAVGSNLLLTSSELACPIAGKLREKVELLSLKIPHFPSLFHLLSFPLSLPLPIHLVKIETRDKSSQCHMSNSYWLRGLHLILLSNHLRFPSNGKMPCVTCEPHLSSSLTTTSLDTCYLLATQNVPSVLHPSRCLEKCEIPTVSELDEIRRSS